MKRILLSSVLFFTSFLAFQVSPAHAQGGHCDADPGSATCQRAIEAADALEEECLLDAYADPARRAACVAASNYTPPVIGEVETVEVQRLFRTVLGYAKWLAGLAGVAGFILVGFQLFIGRRNRSAVAASSLTALPWIAGGLILVGMSSGFAEWVLAPAQLTQTEDTQAVFEVYDGCQNSTDPNERLDCVNDFIQSDENGSTNEQFVACSLIGDPQERDRCLLSISGF